MERKGYPNHYELKKNRLVKLQITKGVCEICGEPNAKDCHHKDLKRNNHNINNLQIAHRKCHLGEHKRLGTKLGGIKGNTWYKNIKECKGGYINLKTGRFLPVIISPLALKLRREGVIKDG